MNKKISYYFNQIFNNFYETSRDSDFYISLDKNLKSDIANSNFASTKSGLEDFGPFGEITMKYKEMGAINSLDLFGLDELLIFAFYWENKRNYQNVYDIGANIGLHSILMSKCGWKVNSFEPDPETIKTFEENISLNKALNITINQMAVSNYNGSAEFTRVLGNTTGSHLTGAKENPYGELDKFLVDVRDIKEIMSDADFIKLDVEGEEGKIITSTMNDSWKNCDMMLEVGSFANAEHIFQHLNNQNVNMFSQKNNWELVSTLDEVPKSYKEGSLFVTNKKLFPMKQNHSIQP